MSLHECPICTELFEPKRKAKVLPCGHTICSQCIPSLRQFSHCCPTCRADVHPLAWERLPDNYAVMENVSKEALNTLIGVRKEKIVLNLQAEEREIKGKLLEIQRDIGEIRRKKKEIARQPPSEYNPAQYQAAVQQFILNLHLNTQEIAANSQNTDLESDKYRENCDFGDFIGLEAVKDVDEEADSVIPEQYRENPVLLTIAMLQDTSNRRQKQLKRYIVALSQLEKIGLQLATDKEKALSAYNHRKSEYTDVCRGLDKSIESAVKERVAAEAYIDQVDREVAGLRGQQELLALEKEELMGTIEEEARDQMLAINKELQCLESRCRGLLDPETSANASKHAYMQLLTHTIAIENANLSRTNQRIAGLKGRLDRSNEEKGGFKALKGKFRSLSEELCTVKEDIRVNSMEKLAEIEEISLIKKKGSEQEEVIHRNTIERQNLTLKIAGNTEKQSKLQAKIKEIRIKSDQNVWKLEKLESKGEKLATEMVNLDAAWAVLDRYHQNVLIPCVNRTILSLFELNQHLSTLQTRPKPIKIANSSTKTTILEQISYSAVDYEAYLKILAEKTAINSDLEQECMALKRKTEGKTEILAQLRCLYAEKTQIYAEFRKKAAGVCFGVFTLALLVL